LRPETLLSARLRWPLGHNPAMPRAPKSENATAPAAALADKPQSIEAIAQGIAVAILEKRLPPGTWLREEALGRVYGVSRTKVRAALLMLSKDRLIEMIPDKGAFVCKPTVQEAREVFAVRRILEAEVVRLFIAKAGPADYAKLEQHIVMEHQAARRSTGMREELLGDFHVALAKATGNQTLTELVHELVARSALIAMLYQSSNDPHCSTDEHADFLRLCRQGKVAAAVTSMTEHLDRIEASLQLGTAQPGRPMDLIKALLA
jgi:DNA-binding GntR family transcriptional regulator